MSTKKDYINPLNLTMDKKDYISSANATNVDKPANATPNGIFMNVDKLD